MPRGSTLSCKYFAVNVDFPAPLGPATIHIDGMAEAA
jgi:hypothetical protein